MDSQRFDQERESVRRAASQLTGEKTSVVHLSGRSVTYNVTGRRRSGSAPSNAPVPRFLRVVVVVLSFVLMMPVAIVASLLSEIGIDLTASGSRKFLVRGEESASALPFADALRQAPRNAWLTWSRSQVNLLTTDDQGPRVLWRSPDGHRPKVQIAKSKIVWADESRVEFPLSDGERNRVVQHNGSP